MVTVIVEQLILRKVTGKSIFLPVIKSSLINFELHIIRKFWWFPAKLFNKHSKLTLTNDNSTGKHTKMHKFHGKFRVFLGNCDARRPNLAAGWKCNEIEEAMPEGGGGKSLHVQSRSATSPVGARLSNGFCTCMYRRAVKVCACIINTFFFGY